MASASSDLERARHAAARADWAAARESVTTARRAALADGGDLDLDDLDLLRAAAWWLGDGAAAMAVDEDVYHRLESAARVDEAARRALDLGMQWAGRGDLTVAGGWLGRARRLLATVPTSSTHGYLRYVDASFQMDVYGDPESATAAAVELSELARTHDEPALACFARVLQGLAGVRAGQVQEGFDALDEAMLDVLSGHLPALWAGDIYCTVIHVSHQLGDWARMRAWTDALGRWAAPLSRTFMYAAVTRVHHLELAAAQGEWDRVEREVTAPSEDLVGSHGWLAGAGFHTLGEVRRLRGDVAGAAAAFERARELGTDPQPAAALLAFDQGRPDEALSGLRLALSGRGALERATLLLPAVRVALGTGDVDAAAGWARELADTASRYGTSDLRARAAHAAALVAVQHGQYATAVEGLEAALTLYREQGLQYDTAQAHEGLGRARRGLGDGAGAAAEAATALAAYRRLGAGPDVDRLAGTQRAGGLTAREEEILGYVVTGASNREVAERLVISEKTVSRHLANIFTKLGVGSRTAAAAWAHDHGIHGTPHATA